MKIKLQSWIKNQIYLNNAEFIIESIKHKLVGSKLLNLQSSFNNR